MSNKPKKTTLHISAEEKEILERLAFEASMKAKKIYTWTDLARHTLNTYMRDGAKDLAHQDEEKNK